MKLSDAQYHMVLGIVDKWRNARQPSYNLNQRNCITFVAEVAVALGLNAPVIPKLMKKPKSYLNQITALNQKAILRWPGGWVSTLQSQGSPATTATATAH